MPLFTMLSPSSTVEEVTRQTHFICVFGATSSAIIEDLKQTQAVKLVFEPDVEALIKFMEGQDIGSLLKNQFFFFVGDFLPYGWSLEEIIPPAMTKLGFPAVYIQPGREKYQDYFTEMIRRIEFAYYRKQIYPAIGQGGMRGTPFRPLSKGMFYDQEHHLLQNILHLTKSGNPKYLKGTYQGTATLLGAGPGLKKRADLISAKNLTITVNSAYGYCLDQQVFPDITLISDTSLEAARSLMGHRGKNPNMLFGHWTSGLGDDHFQNRYVGWDAPKVFGTRPSLEGYGSVASAAFSLAELMGAEECVLTGIHLATTDPCGFSYASGQTGKYYQDSDQDQNYPGYHYPDLYPVIGADGQQLYTTLNFMDTAMVLLERMQQSSLRITNTNTDSLLYGPGITVDPNCDPPPMNLAKPKAITTVMRDPVDLNKVDELAKTWESFYQEVLETSRQVLSDTKRGTHALALAEERIAFYDENYLSYILQRFETFKNPVFHHFFFEEKDTAMRLRGAIYYFEHAHKLARECLSILEDQRQQLSQLMSKHGPIY